MGQISIPMLNKVGYSMYWNSMWDNKVDYASNLTEDIFIKKFLPLIFEDNSSIKHLHISNLKKDELKKFRNKYRIHLKTSNYSLENINKYMNNLKKLDFLFSRVWVLKYQKWIVIYLYIYLPKFNKFSVESKNTTKKVDNMYNMYNNYNIASQKLKFSFKYSAVSKKKAVF